jgi:flagellar biosynthesis protein FliP
MSPVIQQIYDKAYVPYTAKNIDEETAFTEATSPLRKFMLAETRQDDLGMSLI